MNGIVYMKSRIEDMTIPIVFYGEDNKDAIVTATLSDEKKLGYIWSLLLGYSYSYILTISH